MRIRNHHQIQNDLRTYVCHAELDSASALDIVRRFQITFGMTVLYLEFSLYNRFYDFEYSCSRSGRRDWRSSPIFNQPCSAENCFSAPDIFHESYRLLFDWSYRIDCFCRRFLGNRRSRRLSKEHRDFAFDSLVLENRNLRRIHNVLNIRA